MRVRQVGRTYRLRASRDERGRSALSGAALDALSLYVRAQIENRDPEILDGAATLYRAMTESSLDFEGAGGPELLWRWLSAALRSGAVRASVEFDGHHVFEVPQRVAREPAESGSESAWIEVELVDEAGEPVPGERYWIEWPDGAISTGLLDRQGRARVAGRAQGQCSIGFPQLDGRSWESSS